MLAPSPASSAAGADVTYTTVARRGDAAPVPEAGATYNGFGAPSIAQNGTLAFFSTLQGAGAGLFAGAPGALTPVARVGGAAPGTGTTFAHFPDNRFLPVNAAGQVVFMGKPTGASFSDESLWAGGAGSLALVGRSGQQAPGAAAGEKFTFNLPFGSGDAQFFANNDAGQVAFGGGTFGPANGETSGAIYVGAPGSIRQLARTGSAAPGTGGALFGSFLRAPVLNEAGVISFIGDLAGPGVTPSNSGGAWVGTPDALTLAARTGQAAPGLGTPFEAIQRTSINENGQVAIAASAASRQGVWAGTPGALKLVAYEQQPAPGTGGNFISIDLTGPAINDRGQVAFQGVMLGTDDVAHRGIWAGAPGGVGLVALAGQAAPLEAGAHAAHFTYFTGPIINDAGQVAFEALLTADDGSFADKNSLWVADPSGTLHLVAREGGLLDVGGGQTRTLETFLTVNDGFGGALNTHDGYAVSFNDAGQLAFDALYHDPGNVFRDAIIVATVPVPEPAGATVIALAGAMLMRRRRRVRRAVRPGQTGDWQGDR